MRKPPTEQQNPTWSFKRKASHTKADPAPARVSWWQDAPREQFTRRAAAVSFLGHTARREGE